MHWLKNSNAQHWLIQSLLKATSCAYEISDNFHNRKNASVFAVSIILSVIKIILNKKVLYFKCNVLFQM